MSPGTDNQVEMARDRSGRRRWPWVVLSALIVGAAASVIFVHEVATHHYDIDSYAASPSGTLTVAYIYGECDMLRKPALVEESGNRVVVAVTYIPEGAGACVRIGYDGSATFQLAEPPGDRPVFYDNGEEYVRIKQRKPVGGG